SIAVSEPAGTVRSTPVRTGWLPNALCSPWTVSLVTSSSLRVAGPAGDTVAPRRAGQRRDGTEMAGGHPGPAKAQSGRPAAARKAASPEGWQAARPSHGRQLGRRAKTR